MTLPVAIIAQHFPRLVIPLIENAKESIDVLVFDWRFYTTISGSPVSRFNSAILASAERGVSVRALVNNDDVITRLRLGGCEAKRLHSRKMLHTKMLLLDKRLLVIGSHNYTQHAFAMNEEASVFVDLVNTENDFVNYFNRLWSV